MRGMNTIILSNIQNHRTYIDTLATWGFWESAILISLIVKMQCERDELWFSLVAAKWRFWRPISKSFQASSALRTLTSCRPIKITHYNLILLKVKMSHTTDYLIQMVINTKRIDFYTTFLTFYINGTIPIFSQH